MKKNWFFDALNILFLAFIVTVFIRLFFFQIFYISSSSMADTLKKGDYILVWKFLYNKKIPVFNIKLPFGITIKRGDVIVLKHPFQQNLEIVKRCIALSGDKIVIRSNKVYVNGRKINEKYVHYKDKKSMEIEEIIPEDEIFVMGDNRANSADSRFFGSIPVSLIKGKVLFILFPLTRMGVVK